MGGREQDTANRLMGRAEKTLAHSCKPAQGRASLSARTAAARAPSLGLSSCVLSGPVPTGPKALALHFPLLTSWGRYFDPYISKISFSDLWVTWNSRIGVSLTIAHASETGLGVGNLTYLLLSPELLVPPSYRGDSTGILYWLLTTLVMAVTILRPRKDRFREVW